VSTWLDEDDLDDFGTSEDVKPEPLMGPIINDERGWTAPQGYVNTDFGRRWIVVGYDLSNDCIANLGIFTTEQDALECVQHVSDYVKVECFKI